MKLTENGVFINGIRSASYTPARTHIEFQDKAGVTIFLSVDTFAHLLSVVEKEREREELPIDIQSIYNDLCDC